MSHIIPHEQVSIWLSFIADGVKKEAFIGFYETKTTDGKTLYDLITKAISDLKLHLINIVGQCFDGAAKMTGKEKGVAAWMKDSNLALQNTMSDVEPLRRSQQFRVGTISLKRVQDGAPCSAILKLNAIT